VGAFVLVGLGAVDDDLVAQGLEHRWQLPNLLRKRTG
jgi:hypothetical protein